MTGHGVLASLLTLGLWIIVSGFVFYDADDRGYNPWLWAGIVFIFGLFGLLAYGIRILAD